MIKPIFGTAILIALAAPVAAKWIETTSSRVKVAHSGLSVISTPGWNRNSKNTVKRQETWSFDGPLLNRIDFFGGIANGEALAFERNKKREPLPKFSSTMQATDVAELVERTVRITEQAPDFSIDAVERSSFAGNPGFRLKFHFTTGELLRRGEARGSVIAGKLYLIEYSAPALYYFDANLLRATSIMDSAQFL